jgi:hypothetical protein
MHLPQAAAHYNTPLHIGHLFMSLTANLTLCGVLGALAWLQNLNGQVLDMGVATRDQPRLATALGHELCPNTIITPTIALCLPALLNCWTWTCDAVTLFWPQPALVVCFCLLTSALGTLQRHTEASEEGQMLERPT